MRAVPGRSRDAARRAAGTAISRRASRPTSIIPDGFLSLLGKRSVSELRLGDHVETHMTVLFSDIRNFTSLSEAMSPSDNFRFINDYLSRMEPVLSRCRGFIDKTIGDAIMALFPARADSALAAALGMLAQLRRFNAEQRGPGGAPLRIGIGLNTGVMMAGTVGSRHRMETTVIGDSVNLASRLESMTKNYGVPLLISEHTYYALSDASRHDIRFVDRVRIRGKDQLQSVYEVFDLDPPRLRAAKRRTRQLFEDALAHYHFRDIGRAARMLRECLAQCPGDVPASIYLERCHRYRRTGVYEGTGETGRIRWNAQFEIGHALIDAQHRRLFSAVNEFVEAIGRSRNSAQVDKMVAFLGKYVVEHFDDEERCMKESAYPLLQMQREQHERFTRDFSRLAAEIRERISTQRMFMMFRIQLLVVDWIVNHTIKLDKHFGNYLKWRKPGARAKGKQ